MSKYNINIAAPLNVFIGAILISFSSVFVKLVSLEPTVSAFYRVFIGGVILLIFYLIRNKTNPFKQKPPKYIYYASIFFALDLWFWHKSINYVGPGLSTLLANLQILILPFFAFFVFNQKLTKGQFFSITIGLIGLLFIIAGKWEFSSSDYKSGILFGLLTAFAYSSYITCLKIIDHEKEIPSDPINNLLFVSIICSILLAFVIPLENQSFRIMSLSNLIWMLCYGMISHVLGWFLILKGIQQISTTTVGIILISQPVFSFVWDIWFFGRVVTSIELLGIFFIVSSLVICIKSANDFTANSEP